MIKKTVKYEDYNGDTVTEDFYFHLTETEITKMKFSENGGLDKYIEKIMNERDHGKLIDLLDTFILNAYGVKTADGRSLIKTEDAKTQFRCCPAYDEIFMECVGDTDKAVAFITGVLPKKMQENARKAINDSAVITDVNSNNTGN